MTPIKVPFLSDAELESAARELLRKYAKSKGTAPKPPIAIDNIVEGLLGLTLEITDLRSRLGKDDVLGAIFLDDRCVAIDSSLEENEGRFCFTLAHETGHWVLHRPLIEMEKVTVPLFAREPGAKPGPAVICRDKQRDPAEIQADKFAALVLMPAADVRAAMKPMSEGPVAIKNLLARKKAGERISELRSLASDVIDRGNFSNVSNQAMQIRLENLKLVVDASAPQGDLF